MLFGLVVAGLLGWMFYAVWEHASRQQAAMAALRQASRKDLVQRLGTRLIPHRGVAPRADGRWHLVYREQVREQPAGDSGLPDALQTELLCRDHEGRYWHVLATARHGELASTLVLTSLNELRMRRALFNDPKHYVHAFGEVPDRRRIQALVRGASPGDHEVDDVS